MKTRIKKYLTIWNIFLICSIPFFVFPSLTFSGEEYVYERMWPVLEQPWYFSYSRDIAVDSSGYFYVADSFGSRIVKFSPEGYYITEWRKEEEYTSFFPPFFPTSIEIDSEDRLYVTESSKNKVYKYSSNGDMILQWGEYGSDDGQFDCPNGLAVDKENNIYVVDASNNRIQKFTPEGQFITKWGQQGTGDGQFIFDPGHSNRLSQQGIIAIDADNNVYVADVHDSRIQKFNSEGQFILSWNGQWNFFLPTGMVVGKDGNVYVTDARDKNVIVFLRNGDFISKWPTGGYQPWGITVDQNGNLYVTDYQYNEIKKFTTNGDLLQKWASGGSGQGEFQNPNGIATDTFGNIYVADTYNSRIQKFTSTGVYISELEVLDSQLTPHAPHCIAVSNNGDLYIGSCCYIYKYSPDGELIYRYGNKGGDGLLQNPGGIAIDDIGNVYVTSRYGDNIQKFTADGTFIKRWGSLGNNDGEVNGPAGIAIDDNGVIYVCDNNNARIQKFNTDGEFLGKWGSHGIQEGQFGIPEGIAIDNNGNIFVADQGRHKIQIFTPEGKFIQRWGEFGTNPGQMNKPGHIALSPDDNKVFITDTSYNRIQVFKKISTYETTNRLGMTFRFIPGGKFMMGSSPDELERESDETQHWVILSQSFYMQTTEVTQGQWNAVMGNNPSYFQNCGDDCPVEQVSWNDIQTFIAELNARGEGIYRLPTEAEWEYAARGGSTTAFANGDITYTDCSYDQNLDALGWYCGNSGVTYDGCVDLSSSGGLNCAGPHPVAQKLPNAWRLYDMHGNVWEWCQDWHGNYPTEAVTDPKGPLTGSNRMRRGGSWCSLAWRCRAAVRPHSEADYWDSCGGFRLVMDSPPGVSENNSPNIPSSPVPSDTSSGISIDTTLSWSGGDPDIGDTVNYVIYIDTVNPPSVLAVTDHPIPNFDPGALQYNTTYYWKIVSKDNHGAETTGPVWSFTTLNLDSDSDGMLDSWEVANGLNPNVNDAGDDKDGDKFTNLREFQDGTDPSNPASHLTFPEATGRIPDTGQIKCYDDNDLEIACPQPGESFHGQDAQYNINPPSYIKMDSQGNYLSDSATSWAMVRDNVTGLIWEIKQAKNDVKDYSNPHDADNTYSWYDSNPETNGGEAGTPGYGTDTQDFIDALNAADFGGYSDWRLPTVKELSTLVNSGIPWHGSSIDTAWFPYTVSSDYWSSTTHAFFTDRAWLVNFVDACHDVYNNNKSDSYYVRAVRAGQSESLGNLVINGDGTVTDTSKGLMWQKATAPGTYTWQQALAYTEGLTLAGYSDWRLPNRNELQTLVDYSRYIPSINPLLAPNTVSSHYLSSTTYVVSFDFPWRVDFYSGDVTNCGTFKSDSYCVRVVRAGQNRLSDHLVILKPQQASVWTTGNQMAILWDTKSIAGIVRISLSRDGGKTYESIFDSTENDGSHEWTVTGPSSVNCMIKVEPIAKPSKSTTQGLFTIESDTPEYVVSIGDGAGAPGSTGNTITINAGSLPADIAGFQVYIKYNKNILTPDTSSLAIHSDLVALAKSGANWISSAGITDIDDTFGKLNIQLYDANFAGTYIVGSKVNLCAINFSVTPGASPLNYVLEVIEDSLGLNDSMENLVSTTWKNGAFQVSETDETNPTPPDGLQATHEAQTWTNDNTIQISWTASTDQGSGVAGYSFIWDTNQDTNPDNSVEALSTSATSPALADSNSHWFHVRTVDNSGNVSSTAHLGPFYIDTTNPAPPANPVSSSHDTGCISDKTIDVSWTPPDGGPSGIGGYSVLWDTSPGTLPGQGINNPTINATSPTLPDGNNHWVHIRPVDGAGNWSDTAAHLGPFCIETSVQPPGGLIATSDGSKSITLKWLEDLSGGISGYNVYLSFRKIVL